MVRKLLTIALLLALAGTALAAVRGDFSMELEGGRVPLAGDWGFTLLPPAPDLPPGDAPIRFKAAVRNWRVELPDLAATVRAEAVIRVEGNATIIESATATLTDCTLLAGEVRIPRLTVTTSGAVTPHTGALELDSISFAIPQTLSGSGALSRSPSGAFQGNISGRVADLRGLTALADGLMPDALQDIRGGGEYTIDLQPASNAKAGATNVSFTLDVAGLGVSFSGGPVAASLDEARGEVRGGAVFSTDGLHGWDMAADLDMEAFQTAGIDEKLSGRLQFQSGGTKDRLRVKNLSLTFDQPPFAGAPFSFSGTVARTGDGFALRDGGIDLGDAGSVDLAFSLTGTNPSLSLNVEKLRFDVLAPLLDALLGTVGDGGLAAWSPRGVLTADLDISPGKGKTIVEGSGEMRISGAGFASPDGVVMAEGIETALTLAPRDGGGVAAELRVDAGEALFDTIYLNLAEHPMSFTAQGVPGWPARLDDVSLAAELQGFGRITATGRLEPQAGSLEVSTGDLDLTPLFTTFVREPFSLTTPVLNRMAVSGTAGADVAFTWRLGETPSLEARGGVRLDDCSLTAEAESGEADDMLAVRGVQVRLPVAYTLPAPAQPPVAPPEWGSVSLEEVQAGILQTGAISVDATMAPNTLFLGRPGGRGLIVPVLGGEVTLQDGVIANPLSPDISAVIQVSLEGVDLSRLSPGGIPLQGSLSGDLGLVRATLQRVTIPGGLRGVFYGGALTVDGLRVESPLLQARQLFARAYLRSMQLEPLSMALGVGRISGLLSADLDNLQFAYGQPVSLLLKAWSEDTAPDGGDAEKTISLKAVNSISVMGTGSGLSGAGVGLFASFFKEFSYNKIGFSCTLVNDVFQVRGLIREGGVEYLIQKPPLFGINVINGNPNNRISFSDMLDRIKRVVSPSGFEKGEPS